MLTTTSRVPPEPGEWQHSALRTRRQQLPDPDADLVAFVVDAPGRPGTLAAYAVGVPTSASALRRITPTGVW